MINLAIFFPFDLIDVIFHQVIVVKAIIKIGLLPPWLILLFRWCWALLSNSIFYLFQFLEVVNLLLILLDTFHVLHHLILEVVLICVIIIISLYALIR